MSFNVLTIDVEDWYHGCCSAPPPVVAKEKWRVRLNTERILSLLAGCGIKATFFMLGSLAELDPSLVPLIASEGHEIASHGYSHTLVHLLGPGAFRDEIRRTGDILAAQAGTPPVGHRAPQWSLGPKAPWATEILREEGYLYDSSFNPLPCVGDPDGPRAPFQIPTAAGPLLEFPPMVTPSLIGNLPTGGGWGFRFFPFFLIRRTIARSNGAGVPAVLYLHPREVDPHGPRLKLSPLLSFASYGPRSDASVRLKPLLDSFQFKTLKELATEWQSA